jgi:hypothetical protein
VRKLLVLFVLLPAGWARCAAQESIRVDVNLVTVAFSVRDASGGLVDNLTKDDFEVAEDAAPQRIAFFATRKARSRGPRASFRNTFKSFSCCFAKCSATGRTIPVRTT